MTSESPTPSTPQAGEAPPRCADQRCNCPVKEGEQYCNAACADKSSTANYCSCTHDACGPPRCARKGCKCLVVEKGQPCSDVCADESVTTIYCQCIHDACYRECDLVMKGGITSGIVYPPLVYKLHEDNYRFRCIGGTSTGAIAAAITAAAEYGRACGGFDKLDEVKRKLGSGTFLRDLFQPTKEARPLFDILLGAAEVKTGRGGVPKSKGVGRKIFEVIRKLRRASFLKFVENSIVGAMLGFCLALLFHLAVGGTVGWGLVFVLLIFGTLGAITGYALTVISQGHSLYKILTVIVPKNFFGMCTGLKDKSLPQDKEALTNWLNDRINDLAAITDKTRPLTFGMLKRKKFAKQFEDEEGIKLRMVTCNVSQNQPYVLPFTDHLFIFKEDEFRRLFPEEIVNYLKENSAKRCYEANGEPLPDNPLYKMPYMREGEQYFFLPDADDLPVIVATRLSLSYPLLLCALPLYTIVPDKVVTNKSRIEPPKELGKTDLRPNWFSDGGIASNFPIQFFDTWLPTRPTFGVNLVSMPDECFEGTLQDEMFGRTRDLKPEFNSPAANPTSQKARATTGDIKAATASQVLHSEAIYLPEADSPLFTEWVPLTKKALRGKEKTPDLMKFLWSIFTTAQNYRDNMQAMLPSYRERIVQIRLSDEEGGLNLAMPGPTIENAMKKGEEAARVLLEKFNFEVHQWVRFRLLMSQMEQYMEKTYKVARQDPSKRRLFDYPQLIRQAKLDKNYPFRPRDPKEPDEKDWGEVAEKRMEHMRDFIEQWEKDKPKLSEEPPLPESVLRIMPEL